MRVLLLSYIVERDLLRNNNRNVITIFIFQKIFNFYAKHHIFPPTPSTFRDTIILDVDTEHKLMFFLRISTLSTIIPPSGNTV